MRENVLEYRGYEAAVTFDADDNILVGRVIGIRDTIDFHSTTAKGIRKEFKTSIDEYIRMCREDGVEPNRPNGGRLGLVLPESLEASLERVAAKAGKSPQTIALDAIQAAVSSLTGKDTSKKGGRIAKGTRTKAKHASQKAVERV